MLSERFQPMLSERFRHPVQWYWMYVLIAMDEQCGSGAWMPPIIGYDSSVHDDVSESS